PVMTDVGAGSAADYELLDKWRAGEDGAGQELFARHFDSIYGFFETKCESDADELVQATFLACLRAKEQFRKESSFRTYLFTIARNELYRVLRARQRDGQRLNFELSSIAELVSTPGTRLGRNQEHQRLVQAMRSLPVDQQTLLELHYWEELEIGDLAEVFDAPAVTIRTRLHRARKALRDVMLKTEGATLGKALESLESMDVWAKNATRALR
ncbi:MAG TPA: sigma-70 family RNA polymerase sigma factor, partial [Kofleriaceae bacterium]|nr:sigma-70 family RNA polymerase sigma factor [Kofleriaceae bacterium]